MKRRSRRDARAPSIGIPSIGIPSLMLCLLVACQGPTPSRLAPDSRLSAVAAMTQVDTRGFELAIHPRDFIFPADHGPHPDFKLEWWYFVGNLESVGNLEGVDVSEDGRRFGFQLTFFRQALVPEMPERPSAWATRQLYMAHFTLGDIDGGRFFSSERFHRGGVGLAGSEAEPFRVWLEGWSVSGTEGGFLPLHLVARDGEAEIDLMVTSERPWVLQGDDGLSQKGVKPGDASYYYSYTRMPTEGTVRVGDQSWTVRGDAWLDREWSTSGLDENQVGWDWFALQLDDGRDLMFYQLRRSDGSVEPLSHGSVVGPTGDSRTLRLEEVDLEVAGTWTSPAGTTYPALWRVRIPSEGLDLTVEPLLANQELDVAFRYWEGAVGVRGTNASGPVGGRGYVELVGY